MTDGGPRILIVGGGYGGMHTALRLERLQDFRDALHVITTAPSHLAPVPDRDEKEAEQHAYHR